MLSQHHDNGEHFICFLSNYHFIQLLNSSVWRYCEPMKNSGVTKKPTNFMWHCSSIFKMIRQFNGPKRTLISMDGSSTEFDYEIIHRVGKDQIVPDYLSHAVPNIRAIEVTSVKDKRSNNM